MTFELFVVLICSGKYFMQIPKQTNNESDSFTAKYVYVKVLTI